ncbi:MAG TPA: hypothetical protein P5038_03670 [Candidatus Paceibacterota bacterium]|nr:hypothetical protein [Candidatus Paceibacterota bacterium]
MKNLLRQFRISSALDAGTPLPPSVQAAVNRCKELREFQASLTTLDRELRETPPPIAPLPASAHHAILRAIKHQAGSSRAPAAAAWRWRWAVASAVAVPLVVLAAWWLVRELAPPARPPAMASADPALTVPAPMPDQMSTALLGPLAREWHGVRADVTQTVEFLLASIP